MDMPPPVTAASHPRLAVPHRPRELRFIRHEAVGDWRLKVYGIAPSGRSAREALLAATLARAEQVLPHPAVTAERYGVGFVIAHDAPSISIGLIYWWQDENELHQRSFVGPHDDPAAIAKLADPAAGCVWELGIIDFERRMWLQDVLANPGGPDLARYMERRLDADV
jgi:hypothetical protein